MMTSRWIVVGAIGAVLLAVACSGDTEGQDGGDDGGDDASDGPAAEAPAEDSGPDGGDQDLRVDGPVDVGPDAVVTPDAPPPLDMTSDATPGCATTGLTYTASIDPIVIGQRTARFDCTGCHAGLTPRLVSGDPAANYAALGGSAGVSGRGFLYSSGHPPGNIITPGSCEDMQVRAWIAAGAPQ